MNYLKTYEGWFKKLVNNSTPLEKAKKFQEKFNIAWDKLLKEAGGEKGLSIGKEFGYDNFGDVADITYDMGIQIQHYI